MYNMITCIHRMFVKKYKKNTKIYYPVFQIVGIVLQIYMMANISTNPTQRMAIYILCFVLFIGLFIYAVLWVKYKLNLPLMKGIGVHQVMTMESPIYHKLKRELEK